MPVRRWLVAGRVQGVWFRESTRRHAEKLEGVRGWVRNLPDGQVEVCAEGGSAELDRLAEYLEAGPQMASVEGVVEVEAPGCVDQEGFRVLR